MERFFNNLNDDYPKRFQFLESIFYAVPLQVFILNLNGKIIDHNVKTSNIPTDPYLGNHITILDKSKQDEFDFIISKMNLLEKGAQYTYKNLQLKEEYFNLSGTAIWDQNEKISLIFTLENVTENYKKELALKQTQNQLIQNEKMASLGKLIAGIAHEINNPVNFISSGAYTLNVRITELKVLLNKYEEYEKKGEFNPHDFIKEITQLKEQLYYHECYEDIDQLIKTIIEGSDRTIKIVQDLKHFSRAKEEEPQIIDIQKKIESCLNLLQNKYKGRIKIKKKYHPETFMNFKPGLLNQVIMNILANAIEAIENKGTIEITTNKDEIYYYISIKDDGIGISNKAIIKIFDPFYTSKPIGTGTGLGLSISHEIIKNHGGEIHVTSEVGKGSEFVIVLPLDEK